MIQQIFLLLLDHISKENKDKFYELHSTLFGYQRLIQAKNKISGLLQGINRKNVLNTLIKRKEG